MDFFVFEEYAVLLGFLVFIPFLFLLSPIMDNKLTFPKELVESQEYKLTIWVLNLASITVIANWLLRLSPLLPYYEYMRKNGVMLMETQIRRASHLLIVAIMVISFVFMTLYKNSKPAKELIRRSNEIVLFDLIYTFVSVLFFVGGIVFSYLFL